MDIIAPIINFLIDLIVTILEFLIGLLPQTPFKFEPLHWGVFGDLLGYFIPFGTFVTHMVLILSAVGLWYAVRWAMRLIKMIQ